MEAAAARKMTEYSHGSSVFKQVYIYGGLDTGPTELSPTIWPELIVERLAAHDVPDEDRPAETQKLRDRVTRELKTTFASHYTKVVSLQGALKPEPLRPMPSAPRARNISSIQAWARSRQAQALGAGEPRVAPGRRNSCAGLALILPGGARPPDNETYGVEPRLPGGSHPRPRCDVRHSDRPEIML